MSNCSGHGSQLPPENNYQTIADLINSGDPMLLVSRHSVDESSETTQMRSMAEIKDLLDLIGSGTVSCQQRKNAMAGMFAFRGQANRFGGNRKGAEFNNSRWAVNPRHVY